MPEDVTKKSQGQLWPTRSEHVPPGEPVGQDGPSSGKTEAYTNTARGRFDRLRALTPEIYAKVKDACGFPYKGSNVPPGELCYCDEVDEALDAEAGG